MSIIEHSSAMSISEMDNRKYKMMDIDSYIKAVSSSRNLSSPGFSDYTDISSSLDAVKKHLNIDTSTDIIKSNLINKFNRFLIAYPNMQLSKTFGHVFFTRPSLNLYESAGGRYTRLIDKVANDPLYYYLDKNEPQILKSLTDGFSAKHGFNPYLFLKKS